MTHTYGVTVDGQGAVVIPPEVLEQVDLIAGTPLILVESDSGEVFLARAHMPSRIAGMFEGADLVAPLLAGSVPGDGDCDLTPFASPRAPPPLTSRSPSRTAARRSAA